MIVQLSAVFCSLVQYQSIFCDGLLFTFLYFSAASGSNRFFLSFLSDHATGEKRSYNFKINALFVNNFGQVTSSSAFLFQWLR